MEADGLLLILCNTGTDRGLSCASSGSLCRRRLDGRRSPFSSVGELVVELSTYWHLSRLSRHDRHGSPGISMWPTDIISGCSFILSFFARNQARFTSYFSRTASGTGRHFVRSVWASLYGSSASHQSASSTFVSRPVAYGFLRLLCAARSRWMDKDVWRHAEVCGR